MKALKFCRNAKVTRALTSRHPVRPAADVSLAGDGPNADPGTQ